MGRQYGNVWHIIGYTSATIRNNFLGVSENGGIPPCFLAISKWEHRENPMGIFAPNFPESCMMHPNLGVKPHLQ